METINVHKAKTQFSRLIEKAISSEEGIIAKAGKPVARLIAYAAKGAGLGVCVAKFGSRRTSMIRCQKIC